jgi:molybdopterin converting factor small subunit
MATVVLSSGLRGYTGGAERVEIEARRVSELVDALVARWPQLEEPLSQMAVAIDGEIHGNAQFKPLRPDSEVHFVPKIGGG